MSTDKNKNEIKEFLKGPSHGYTDNFPKRELWKEISEIYDGEFKIKHNSSNELEIHNTTIPFKDWEIKISISDTHPLKFEAEFKAIQDFELFLSWEGFIESIYKWFGKKEIKVGWKQFDDFYLIETNKPHLLREILTSDVQKTLLKNKVYSVIYSTDNKSNTGKFISVIRRNTGTKESIIELIEMVKALLDNLQNQKIIN